MTFRQFDTWAQVIAHVFDNKPIWYQAPLDVRPVPVTAYVIVKTGKYTRKVRVIPPSSDADSFWADAGHLERFKMRVAD